MIHGKKGDTVFDTDEYPKFGTTLEKVAKLKPAFKKDGGTVTAAEMLPVSTTVLQHLL